jgi:uncharacterized protein (TIGR00304 family)
MRSTTVRRLGILLFIVGFLGTALSVYYGIIRFYLVVIVPVLTSDNALGAIPLLAMFAGIVLMAIGPAFGDEQAIEEDPTPSGNIDSGPRENKPRVGGVVLIGPIPVVFGSDRKMALIASAIMIIILAIVILILL